MVDTPQDTKQLLQIIRRFLKPNSSYSTNAMRKEFTAEEIIKLQPKVAVSIG